MPNVPTLALQRAARRAKFSPRPDDAPVTSTRLPASIAPKSIAVLPLVKRSAAVLDRLRPYRLVALVGRGELVGTEPHCLHAECADLGLAARGQAGEVLAQTRRCASYQHPLAREHCTQIHRCSPFSQA